MSRERNSLRKRVSRYARVSTAMAGIGARAAGGRVLGIKADPKKEAERLRAALGGLKGPLMKVAQLLSTIPDLVPKEYAQELAQLQADAPSMGWPFVRRRMAAELGRDWEKKFRFFEHTASAAASLGQVHKAVGKDGRVLACKLQYPDMESVVAADLRQLKLILAIFERYDRAVSTAEVQKEIAERLHEELDYALEAKHIALYRHMLENKNSLSPHRGERVRVRGDSPYKTDSPPSSQTLLPPEGGEGLSGVHVPETVPALSTARLLTMTWMEGERLAVVADERPLKDRNRVAMNMFRAWYMPFYYYGAIHGDPHPGNYTVRKDGSVNLLDFGCIRVFGPPLVEGVIKLYNALLTKDRDLAVEAYKAWGFRDLSKDLVDTLNIWAKFIYAPLLEDKTRPIEETNTGLYGRETASKVHRELRKLGGITVPREFVFMDRAAVGLGAVFLRLGAEINWYRLFHELIRGFDVAALARRQGKALKAAGL